MNAERGPIGSVDRTCMAVIAAIGCFALALQFYLMIIATPDPGADRIRLTFNYFSFFTILTNLLVVLGLTFRLVAPRSRWSEFFSRPAVAAGIAVYIAIVGVTYSLLLRSLWSPQGGQRVADILLHDLVPIMYVTYWLIFIPRGSLLWKNTLSWTIYPLLYFFYSLIRGAVTGWYPYPFIDVSKFGYPRVLANAAMLVCAFLTVALLTVAIGRLTGRNPQPASREFQ
jgi:hypothetical protein